MVYAAVRMEFQLSNYIGFYFTFPIGHFELSYCPNKIYLKKTPN